MSKMRMTIDDGKCIGCDVCVEECPVDAIKKEDDYTKLMRLNAFSAMHV